jgi:hypothetical protein
MKWLYLTIPLVFAAALVPMGGLSLGHAILHLLTPAMAAVPLYLSIRAYRRAGGQRLLNLATAFGLLFAGQSVLSYSMYTSTFIYFGDIPLDHLIHYVAFIFFTMALLGDRERPHGKLHHPLTRPHTEEAADDAPPRAETPEEIYWCEARYLRAMGTTDSATKADVRKT